MYHFGDADKSIPPATSRQFARPIRKRRCILYEGAGHGFNCDQRDSYDPQAAALARNRTLEFLARYLATATPTNE